MRATRYRSCLQRSGTPSCPRSSKLNMGIRRPLILVPAVCVGVAAWMGLTVAVGGVAGKPPATAPAKVGPAANAPYAGAACAAPVDDHFANEVWAKVGAQTCLECHKAGGDAEDSAFV